jgi:TetR/AcrR family transcriptional regulator, transcriptional repressor for nem operon
MYEVSKREALIEATKGLLWERGYGATSPRDILRKSGAGQGSLYHFFDGKEALATEAMRAVASEVSERTAVTCGPGAGTGMQRIERFLMGERDPLRGCRLGRMTQDPDLPESVRLSVARGLDSLRSVLEGAIHGAQRDGELRAELDAEALADLIMAAVQGGYVLARAHGSRERMTRVTGGVWTILSMLTPRSRAAAASKRRERATRKSRRGVKVKPRKDRDGKPKPGI